MNPGLEDLPLGHQQEPQYWAAHLGCQNGTVLQRSKRRSALDLRREPSALARSVMQIAAAGRRNLEVPMMRARPILFAFIVGVAAGCGASDSPPAGTLPDSSGAGATCDAGNG